MESKWKYLVWGIALLVVLINVEPAVKLGILGKMSDVGLSLSSPPEWAYPLFGLSSVFLIVFTVFVLLSKKWAAFAILVLCLPHTYSAFLCAGYSIGLASIYLACSLALAGSFLVLNRVKVKSNT